MGHILQGQEGVGPPQDRAPSAQVDDHGDGGGLDGDAEVEPSLGRRGVVEAVGSHAGQRDGDEDGQPQPGRLAGRLRRSA